MANTTHNPITTKWSGAVGGFQYRILRGKQIIAERASHVKNPQTAGQIIVRMKFKLSAQFSSLWKGILEANLAKVQSDSVMARALATSVAYQSAVVSGNHNEAAVIDLEEFAQRFNARTRMVTPPSTEMSLMFNASAQTITASEGALVAYQVVAFDQASNPIGSNVETYISDGTAHTVQLPRIAGDAARYDCMAFCTVLDSTTAYTGPLGNITGDDPESLNANTYSVLVEALSSTLGTIKGILTGSYLVA